jgi:hypothetical protein
MTDLLERRAPAADAGADVVIEPEPAFNSSPALRLVIAAASAGAGAIHLAMVPSHWGESAVDGVLFAVCGWLQVAFAGVVLLRPRRSWLALGLVLGLVLNAAAVAAWVISRTIGLPFGAHSGVAEDAGFVDGACVALEALVVVLGAFVLARPGRKRSPRRTGLVVGGIASIAVLALATAALASPSARNHGAHSHTDAAAGDGHTHAGVPAGDDKGFSLLHNGQHDHTTMQHKLDVPTQAKLDAQLAVTRDIARKTPTVADAVKAGYSRVGPYFPGIGAHYWKGFTGGAGFSATRFNPDGVIDDADLRDPLMLIFDGTQPTSKIAGFMYYSMSPYEPEGFAGRNDTWHYHEKLCLKYGPSGIDVPFGLDNSATDAQCASVGGMMLTQSQYMVHVWSVPGFEMNLAYGGVFGETNPKLACADGTYYELPLDQWPSHPMNVCKAQ